MKELKLADNGDGGLKNVDMLIGADWYWEIVSGNLKRNPDTGLVAISSALGWLMNGPIIDDPGESVENTNLAVSHTLRVECEKSEDALLSEEIKKFWRLDLMGIEEKEESDMNEELAKIEVNRTTGRYTCELPIKEGHPFIPDNFTLSKVRLRKLKERLDKDEQLKKQYDEIMQDQLKKGIIEKVENPGISGQVTYLPHRAVVRNDKSTTKVRIVFDGSAKRVNQASLNEILHTGPALNPSIFELLLKFRIYQVVLTADMEKAYLQLEVAEKHRDLMRFLYYSNIFADNPEIIIMRFCRVIFGISHLNSS